MEEKLEKLEIVLNEDQENAVKTFNNFMKDEQALSCCLEGVAGTGKTFLISHYFKTILKQKLTVRVSAPTNKAKELIGKMSGFPANTIHSILGLRPDTSLENYNPTKPMFSKIASKDTSFNILVVDEASMINKKLYDDLLKTAKEEDFKIIFLGDRYQLPPINESLSKVFLECDYKPLLNTTVRQELENPNYEVSKKALNSVIYKNNDIEDFLNKSVGKKVKDKSFYNFLNGKKDVTKFFKDSREELISGDSIILCFSNAAVSKINLHLRNKVLNFNETLDKNDILIGYRNVSNKIKNFYDQIIVNSLNYKIKNFSKITKYFREVNDNYVECNATDDYDLCFSGYDVKLIETENKSSINTFIVDHNDIYYDSYIEIVSFLFYNAINYRKKSYWEKYYNFINNNLTFVNIIKNGDKIKKKDLDYGYAITVHKSQGSTYKNCYINYKDINKCKYFSGIDFRNRLLYVALTRSNTNNYII